MSENQSGELQDPAEPHRVDQVVETHTAGEDSSEADTQTETHVETTVTESSSED